MLSFVVGLVSIVAFSQGFQASVEEGMSLLSAFAQETSNLPIISWIEVAGTVTGATSVYLVIQRSILCWPVGIAWVLITSWVSWEYGLPGEVGLMQVYLVFQVHGWWSWLHGGVDRTPLFVTKASPRTLSLTMGAVAIGTVALMPVIQALRGAAPFWDSLTTAMSLGAQFLTNRKHLESWVLWIVADLIYVPLYLSRGMYGYAVLFCFFLALAVMGLTGWHKAYKTGQAVE